MWATGEIASIGLAGVLVDRAGIVAVYLGGGALLVLAGALGLVASGPPQPGGRRGLMASRPAHPSAATAGPVLVGCPVLVG